MAIKNRNTVWNTAHDSSRDSDMYIQLPKISEASLPTVVADGSSGENEGGIVYDKTNNVVKVSDGSSWTEIGGATSGANKALSNLASVAINTSLVSDADSTDDLGSSAKYWANAYVDKVYLNATASLDGATAGKVDITGNVDISGNLDVEGTISLDTVLVDSLTASTANGDLSLDGDGTGGVDIGSTSTGGITLGDDVTVASEKTVTLTGEAAGTDALTLTAGDIALTDGNIDMAEGKIEVDTTADETTYVKRNKSGASSAVVEIEVTHTGDTGSALLIDHNGTGNAKGLEISHDGDYAAIDISAGAAREGNVINIPMANQLAQTAIDITGAATGTNGEGIVHIDVTGVLAGDAFRVDSTGANAATASLFKGISAGKQASATDGIVAYFEDTGAATATSYTVYIASTNNEALYVDTGEVQFDEALTLGVDNTGADFLAYGATTGKFIHWDESADTFIVADDTVLEFGGEAGTADGVTFDWDDTASSLDIDAVNANEAVTIGSDTDTDFAWHGTSGAVLTADASDDSVTISAAGKLVVTGDATGDGTNGLEIPYHATATPNGAPGTGSIMFEVDANKLWVYNGETWVGTTLA